MHNWSTAYFYEFLNRLDDTAFHEQLSQGPQEFPILYATIIESLKKKSINPSQLACTDGHPVEWLGSLYIWERLIEQLAKNNQVDLKGKSYVLLDRVAKEALTMNARKEPGQKMDSSLYDQAYHFILNQQDLDCLALAAINGSYAAANSFTTLTSI